MSAPEKAAANLVQYETSFEGQEVSFYEFRGRLCWIAAHVGHVLGYANEGKKLVDVVRVTWADEMIVGRDFDTLTGEDLRAFKALLPLTHRKWVSHSRHLTILYETGMDLVCIKTEKPAGQRLRRMLVTEVLPKLRRGEPILSADDSAPKPPQVTLDEAIEAPPPEERAKLSGRRSVALAVPALPAPAEPAQPLERNLARAFLLLGPSLDPRLRSALITSAPPARLTVEHYLQLAATLTEILAEMPGFLAIEAPDRRLKDMEMSLAQAEREIAVLERRPADARIVYQDLAGISFALSSVGTFYEALSGLTDEALLERRAVAAHRLRDALRAFSVLAERDLPPREGTPSAGAATPVSSTPTAPAPAGPAPRSRGRSLHRRRVRGPRGTPPTPAGRRRAAQRARA